MGTSGEIKVLNSFPIAAATARSWFSSRECNPIAPASVVAAPSSFGMLLINGSVAIFASVFFALSTGMMPLESHVDQRKKREIAGLLKGHSVFFGLVALACLSLTAMIVPDPC
jgi:hypothetical protein